MRTKNRQINFRLTEKEFLKIKKRCDIANMNISNFLIYSALDKDIIIVDGLPEFYHELRKIGVNLNQLTKLCNQGLIVCPDISVFNREVNNLWQSLNLLTQKVV